jgi:hypothetical protein
MVIHAMVTVFDAYEYDFWNMSLVWAQISYFWVQIVTNTILEMNESIIFKLVYNYMHIQATFLNKKFERLRDPLVVFFAKFS